MPEQVTRRLAGILIADVVGYSGLMSANEAATLAALKAVRRDVIEPAVDRYAGRIVKLTGDGILAEFPSIVGSVQCAVDIQEQMGHEDYGTEPVIRFRIGINLGDIIDDEDDVYGDAVNIAARLEVLAEPGGICVSERVYAEVRQKIDIAFEDMGPQAVKNIPDPVHTYRITLGAGRPVIPAPDTDEASPAGASIAVLPFTNMSDDASQTYFSDGITEDLITDLAQVPGLTVIARHSSFAYKGASLDAKRIARELAVRYLLEGSVRRAGDRLRITAQLIDGVTGGHLWAERFDRELRDVFAMQDDVAGRIVAVLAGRLGLGAAEPRQRQHPTTLEAYELTLRSRQPVWTADGRVEARQALLRAIEIEPTYAEAYAWLAVYHYTDAVFFGGSTEPAMEQAFEAAHRAVELDPGSTIAHMAVGIVSLYACRRREALLAFDTALKLNPNDADVLTFLQEALTFEGRPEQAVHSVRKAMRLNPHYPDWYLWHLGFALYSARRYDEAIEVLGPLETMNEPMRILAASLAMVGRTEEARATAARFLANNPTFSIREWAGTQPFKNEADLQHFVDGYRKAGLPM